jgi:hypothetical protein
MVSRLTNAFRGASFRKHNRLESRKGCDERSGIESDSFQQIDAVLVNTDALDAAVCDPSTSGSIATTDDDSDMDSLSQILGGPYQPSDRRDELVEVPIHTVKKSQITGVTPENHLDQSSDKLQRDSDVHANDESTAEEELRSLVELFGEGGALKTMSQRSLKLWKRQLKQLMHRRRLSGEIKKKRSGPASEVDDDEVDGVGELLEYGGNTVIIHFETREIARHRPESSEEQEKNIVNIIPDIKKAKSLSRLDRWKEVACAWKRVVNLGKFIPKKTSRFDDLSTNSSSDSEVIDSIHFSAFDISDSFTNIVPLLP